jgi:catechol-2,3-dioxygenase
MCPTKRRLAPVALHIREVEIASSSPSRELGFYREALGLHVVGDLVRVGATTVRFVEGKPAGPYHLAFNVPSNRIVSAKQWVQQRATMLSDQIFEFDFWDAQAAYFEDADGNILELIARHTLTNATDAEFGPQMLLEVSELGLPVADVGNAVGRLEDVLGLRLYSGDRTAFAAVGDEHGLFIVVPAGRTWLPTERRSAESHARVVITAPRAATVTVGGVVIVSA